jgi:hypothetical protein
MNPSMAHGAGMGMSGGGMGGGGMTQSASMGMGGGMGSAAISHQRAPSAGIPGGAPGMHGSAFDALRSNPVHNPGGARTSQSPLGAMGPPPVPARSASAMSGGAGSPPLGFGAPDPLGAGSPALDLGNDFNGLFNWGGQS